MPELNRLHITRIVALSTALDTVQWPDGCLVFRVAPDEAWVTPPAPDLTIDDPHAIIISDASNMSCWIAMDEALEFLEHSCEWELPLARPALAQGAVAGIPTKLWFEEDYVLFIVPAPYSADFEERLA
ncbi:MAG: hypothetical protein AAF485_07125 [Chloroflexota bacterium]